ncbi:MAG: hypothetical protein CBE49_000690 [Rickettsiales bacterium TMED289]|nr:MAG: hypothetical protein CBE49_000690 [Rickettsiales bacterium TMED289]
MNNSLSKKNRYFLDKFSQIDKKNYSLFAQKNFGSSSYQFKKSYLDYLYSSSPYSNGYEDLTLIKQNSFPKLIVGCLHRIKVKLVHSSTGIIKEVSSLHNLMIDNDHYGCGYMLLSDALNKDPIFFVPGVEGELNKFYKRVAHFKVNASWFRKITFSNPINTIKRLLKIPVSKKEIEKYKKNFRHNKLKFLLKSDSIFEDLIQKDFQKIDGFRVTEDFLKWRVFSAELAYVTRLVIHDGKSFIAITFGIRKNIPVCRIIYCSMNSQQSSDLLFSEACNLSKALGFLVILHASDCYFSKNSCAKQKFIQIKDSPNIYFCSKSKDNVHSSHWGLLGDYGFDEFSFSKNRL